MTTRHFRRLCTALAVVPLLTGWAALDSAIEGRARSVNSASGDYSSVAILTNIVRAKNYEPLNFVSLTGFTGHDTLNSAMPSFVLPPANPVAVGFGSSTASTVFSNDFNVSVLDDPGSYAALLEPINPALMGLFIKAGYPRELIYLLFFDYIRVKDAPEASVYYNLAERRTEDINRIDMPYDCQHTKHDQMLSFYKTICKIETLVSDGLTVDIDSDFQPASDVIPSYHLCFDAYVPIPIFKDQVYGQINPGHRATPQCGSPDRKNVRGWQNAESGSPITPVKIAGNSKAATSDLPHERRASYTVLDTDGQAIEIHTRSVLGAYQYLGQILHYQFENVRLRYADTLDEQLLQLTSPSNGECFVSITEKGETYCVPNRAANTKRIFSLLRQLTGLLTKPNNQAATSTVRNTPN